VVQEFHFVVSDTVAEWVEAHKVYSDQQIFGKEMVIVVGVAVVESLTI